MPATNVKAPQPVVIQIDDFNILFKIISGKGYEIIGPTAKDGAVTYGSINTMSDLPVGMIDRQDGGTYRLIESNQKTLFGYVVGQDSWKKFLYPPKHKMLELARRDKTFDILSNESGPARRAFLGVRACELAAIAIHDKILLEGPYADPHYRANRENALIIAVNCTRAGGTCFCVSMGTGPKAKFGFDLALTEIIENGSHHFLIESGSDKGAEILGEIGGRPANENEIKAAAKAIDRAANNMGRNLDTEGLKELLQRNFDHPRWDQVATRCLNCGNCTMVCPTCFCMTIEDATDLDSRTAARWRKWDSCFTLDFSYIHGGSIRPSGKARYRQWLMHKLANWVDQFGMFGCVGCGRCITWCPVGIDLTEEAGAIRSSEIEK